ncbi:MAG: metallophosphoesterase [Solobacterium sp.]|nr:metallophosphoesterase [Solobacterium sp.]
MNRIKHEILRSLRERVFVVLKIAAILSLGLCGCTESSQEEPLKAVITSDLHFTIQPEINGDIVPAMPYAREMTEVMSAQVMEMNPDVFIMTGDNTNSGRREDIIALVDILQKIKNAGIPVILTTGNHDKDQCTKEEYEELYFSLLEPEERDTETLSYSKTINDTVFLVMDDSFCTEGTGGQFPASTMTWLKEVLKEHKDLGHRIIFLSHHSVLTEDNRGYYQIQNQDLYKLLKKYGVKLCFTGHQHAQVILHKQKMYEIISGMTLTSPHRLGILECHGREVVYHTELLDITRLDAQARTAIEEGERQRSEEMRDIFLQILVREGVGSERIDGTMNLVMRYLAWQGEGVIGDHVQEITQDAYYQDMMTALKDTNYGPWISSILNAPPLPADHLEFTY